MTAFRSLFYLILFIFWGLLVGILRLPSLLSPNHSLKTIQIWSRGVLFLAKIVCGINLEIKGRENLPKGPFIIAAQHQSAFETYALYLIFMNPAFVIKESLQWIPIAGWYIKRSGAIGINRGSGTTAMRKILKSTQEAITNNKTIIIFPEGTRTTQGEDKQYKPGVVALYKRFNIPIIPMALNSGRYWGKNSLLKNKGKIIFQFLPPIKTKLSRDQFMIELKNCIQNASQNL